MGSSPTASSPGVFLGAWATTPPSASKQERRYATISRLDHSERRLWVRVPPLAHPMSSCRPESGRGDASSGIRRGRGTRQDVGWPLAPEGGIPERSKGPDCKSGGTAFAGSNPASPIWFYRSLCDVTGEKAGFWATRNNCANCGRSSTVEPQPSKLVVWVRFPSPALAAAMWGR